MSPSMELSPWHRVASFLLAVQVHKHLIKLHCELQPCGLGRVCCIQDPVDLLGHPGACGASFHVQEDKQDAAPFICELSGPHAEVEGAFCLEMVQVILGTREWSGGHNLRQLWGRGGGSTRLRWGRGLTKMSKLGLEGHKLCCQLVDMLFGEHGEAVAHGLQGGSVLLLSGQVHDQERTG